MVMFIINKCKSYFHELSLDHLFRGRSGIPLFCPTNSQTPEDSSSDVINDNKKLTFKKLEPAYVLDFCRNIAEMVKQSSNELWIKLL